MVGVGGGVSAAAMHLGIAMRAKVYVTSRSQDKIDWAIEHRGRFNIRILNLSLGHPVFESYKEDPLCQAVQRAVDAGMVVVTAAGNFGKTEDGKAVIGGIVSPGNSPAASRPM